MPVQADIRGRMVILLEDIIDTGFTMSYVMEKLRSEGAADVRLATMLFKPESLKCELTPDYVGLQIPADFIVGHGWIMMSWAAHIRISTRLWNKIVYIIYNKGTIVC